MFGIFSLSTIFCCLFGLFVTSQEFYSRNFRGASRTLYIALNGYAMLGMTVSFVYYLTLWYNTHWYTSLLTFVLSLLFTNTLGSAIARKAGVGNLSLAGFITVPLFGVLMFVLMPK